MESEEFEEEFEEVFSDDIDDLDHVLDGRFVMEEGKIRWLILRRRRYGGITGRRVIFEPGRRGRGGSVKHRITVRLSRETMEERLRIFDELLRRYGLRTTLNLGEFDRAVYEIGLKHILEEAEKQARNMNL